MNRISALYKKTLGLALMLLIGTTPLWGQSLIYYWNFNNNIPGTNQNWEQPIPANIGAAQITYTFTEAFSFAGTIINGIEGEIAGGSFAPRGGVDNINNGAYLTINAPTTGYNDIVITYPTRRTSTGFNTQEIQYTIDGSTWVTKETFDISLFENNWLVNQIIVVNFSEITAVDNNPDFAVRIILNGTTSSAGNNRFDNIQVLGFQPGGVVPPSNFTATAVSTIQVDLNWQLNTNNNTVLLAWTPDGIFGTPSGNYQIGDVISGGGNVLYLNAGTAFNHVALDPNTIYYYKLWSFDGTNYSTGITKSAITFPEPNFTTLPYTEAFDLDLGDCLWYNVSGFTKYWIHGTFEGNGYASMNGFNSGDFEIDWLILPGVNLNNYANEVLTFDTWWRYGIDDENNYLKLFYSTNYPGNGNPVNATWIELEFIRPTLEQSWTSSGSIDLSQIQGELVYIGFKYQYEVGKYKWWQVDNISMTGDTGTILPGDANCDGIVNILDVISLVNYIVGMNPQPFCPENADLNADGQINILDIVITTNIIMQGS